jgi:hypothetical protein
MNCASLTGEFQKFVGTIIKDPNRTTNDKDPEADKIREFAHQKGVSVQFYSADRPNNDPFMVDVIAAHVAITKDGVPADQPDSYRVLNINVG